MDSSFRLSTALAAPLRPLAAQLASALAGGESVLVTGMDGTSAVLAAASDALVYCRTRVLRVRPPLDLSSFMDQVAHEGVIPGDVTDLEQGFDALTRLNASYDRIALLVEDAHRMPETTLRYIELALRAGPHLRVALAGQAEVADTIALPGFSGLRKRLSLHLVLPAPDLPAIPMVVRSAASTAPVGRKRGAQIVGALAGAAFAAGLAVAVWLPDILAVLPSTPAKTGLLAGPSPLVAALPEDTAPVEGKNPAIAALVEAIPAPAPPDAIPAETLPTQAGAPMPQAVAIEAQDAQPISAENGANPPAGLPLHPSATTEPELALSLPAIAEPPAAPAPGFAEAPATRHPDVSFVPEPSLTPPLETHTKRYDAIPAQTPRAVPPDEARPKTAILPAPNPVRRTPQAHAERAAARFPVPGVDVRHCRDIVLRAQLGENLTHGDQSFMRNGCR